MIEQHGTADFYFSDDHTLFRPKHVFVFVEGEYGFIPLIVSKSIEGKEKPMVEVISEHQCIDAFNQMPKLLNPSWTMTQIDKSTVVVSITNWWPLNVDLHSNPEMWSHAYPMIRDIILGLKAHGCEALTFFTCMNNQESTDNPEIMVYDMHNDIRPREDLILTPPAWIFRSSQTAWDSEPPSLPSRRMKDISWTSVLSPCHGTSSWLSVTNTMTRRHRPRSQPSRTWRKTLTCNASWLTMTTKEDGLLDGNH